MLCIFLIIVDGSTFLILEILGWSWPLELKSKNVFHLSCFKLQMLHPQFCGQGGYGLADIVFRRNYLYATQSHIQLYIEMITRHTVKIQPFL